MVTYGQTGVSRRASRVDDNHAIIVSIFRSMGVSVADTSGVHGGFPDIVIGFGGVTVLVEIKDGKKCASKRKLRPTQVKFHRNFKGAITVVESACQAIALANEIRRVSTQINPRWNVGAVAQKTEDKIDGSLAR